MSLKEIVDHIYGRTNVITRTDRPNMFIKELKIYIDFLKNKVDELKVSMNEKHEKYLLNFADNLKDGIIYYDNLFNQLKDKFEDTKLIIFKDLELCKNSLHNLKLEIENLSLTMVADS